MGIIQQFGYNLYVLYNLFIIYIYNHVSIFFIKPRNFSKEFCCTMQDGIEFHVTAPGCFAESLPLVTVFTEGTSRSINQGSYRERVYLGTYKLQSEVSEYFHDEQRMICFY